MLHKVGPRALLYPTTNWLIIVVLLFATEYAVMMVLPTVLPADHSYLLEAVVDALTVTAVLAPVIWWTLVRPLREVIRLRTRLLGELFTAIEAERRQTAHDLHDGVGQELSLLISGLRTAHESIADPEDSARCLELQKLAQKALKEVKRVALRQRPSLLDDFGLAAAVEMMAQDVNDHTCIEAELRTRELEGVRLPDTVESAAFRILQEALSNVIRHSGADRVTMELRQVDDTILLSIQDNGHGFDPQEMLEPSAERSHMGLIGMHERAALLGGQFTLATSPGHGCRITVVLPIDGKIHG